jgi:hypothetical protein
LQLGGTSTATGTQVNIGLNGNTDPGSGILTIGSGATFDDRTTSTGLNILASNFGVADNGAAAVMNNLGTFTKSGSAVTSTISTTFNNKGTVDVQTGTLSLSGGGTDAGATYQGAGTVNFSGGTRTLDAASSIKGNATFSAGTTTINATFNDPGMITVNGGTLTLPLALTVGALTETRRITQWRRDAGGNWAVDLVGRYGERVWHDDRTGRGGVHDDELLAGRRAHLAAGWHQHCNGDPG